MMLYGLVLAPQGREKDTMKYLSSLWPAFVGLLACLDFGPGSLFRFLALPWVLSLYKVWQGFINTIAFERPICNPWCQCFSI
jgi:hypothetical protein